MAQNSTNYPAQHICIRCLIWRSIWRWLIGVLLVDCRQMYTEACRLINELFQRLMYRCWCCVGGFFLVLFEKNDIKNRTTRLWTLDWEWVWTIMDSVSMKKSRYYQSLGRLKAFLRWIDEWIVVRSGEVNVARSERIYDSKNYHVILLKCASDTSQTHSKSHQLFPNIQRMEQELFLLIYLPTLLYTYCIHIIHYILHFGYFAGLFRAILFCVRV